jgi:hypothetical protein
VSRWSATRSKADVKVDAGALAPDDVVEVVLDASSALRARILDGSEPLAGIGIHLYNRTGAFLLGYFASDDSGRVESGPLAGGEYLAVIRQPGVWGCERVLTAGSDEHVIQIPRLGDLRVRVETAFGAPAAGIEIGLWSEQFERDVSDWVRDGLVPEPPGGLRTDSLGEVTVAGLPHGAYRCTAMPNGSAVSETVDVPARARADLVIGLP